MLIVLDIFSEQLDVRTFIEVDWSIFELCLTGQNIQIVRSVETQKGVAFLG